MRDLIGKTVKLAVFRNVEPDCMNGFETIDGESYEKAAGYVRISEYIEVQFPKLKDEIVIDKYIEALDRSERRVRLEFQEKLDEIATQRSNLLALTHKPA